MADDTASAIPAQVHNPDFETWIRTGDGQGAIVRVFWCRDAVCAAALLRRAFEAGQNSIMENTQ